MGFWTKVKKAFGGKKHRGRERRAANLRELAPDALEDDLQDPLVEEPQVHDDVMPPPPTGRDVLTRARRGGPPQDGHDGVQGPPPGRLALTRARRGGPVNPWEQGKKQDGGGGPGRLRIGERGPKFDHMASVLDKYKGEYDEAQWRYDQGEVNPAGGKIRTADLSRETGNDVSVDGDGRLMLGDAPLDTSVSHGDVPGRDQVNAWAYAMNGQGKVRATDAIGDTFAKRDQYWERMQEVFDKTGKNSWEELTEDERQAALDEGGLDIEHVHHSSLFGGKDVGGAGFMRAREGRLKYLDANSGHYQPDTKHTVNVLKELQGKGANLDDARVGVMRRDADGNVLKGDQDEPLQEVFHSGEVLASGGDDKALMGKRSFLDQLKALSGKVRGDDERDDFEYKAEDRLKDKMWTTDEVRRRAAKKGYDIDEADLARGVVTLSDRDESFDPRELLKRAKKWKPQQKEALQEGALGKELSKRRDLGDVGPRDPLPQKQEKEKKYDKLARLDDKYQGEHTDAKWRADEGEVNKTGGKLTTAALTKEGQDKRRVTVDKDGLLRMGSGRMMDTSDAEDSTQHGGLLEAYIFGMDESGDILAGDGVKETSDRTERKNSRVKELMGGKNDVRSLSPEQKEAILKARDAGELDDARFHHSSFFNGEDLAGAGELRVKDGILKRLTASSGHYRPDNEQTVNVLDELQERGANLDHALVDVIQLDKYGDKKMDGNKPVANSFHAGEVLASRGDSKVLHNKKSFLDEIKSLRTAGRQSKDSNHLQDQLEAMIKRGASEEKVRQIATSRGLEVIGIKMDKEYPTVTLAEDREVDTKKLLKGAKSRWDEYDTKKFGKSPLGRSLAKRRAMPGLEDMDGNPVTQEQIDQEASESVAQDGHEEGGGTVGTGWGYNLKQDEDGSGDGGSLLGSYNLKQDEDSGVGSLLGSYKLNQDEDSGGSLLGSYKLNQDEDGGGSLLGSYKLNQDEDSGGSLLGSYKLNQDGDSGDVGSLLGSYKLNQDEDSGGSLLGSYKLNQDEDSGDLSYSYSESSLKRSLYDV